jgi:UDP-2,3-diacylglucosamine pyrophosphatase LpxH
VKEPVRIISDLHLGHRISRIERVEMLRPLLAGAGTVVFNGDTWQELAKDLKEHSAGMLEGLRQLCREEGCEPVFLPGNHDPGWTGDGYLELAGGKIVVTHGDTLLRSGAPWKREIILQPERVERLWSQHPEAAVDAKERHQLAREISLALPVSKHSKGRKFTQRAWDAIHPPQRALEMLKAWWSQPAMGEAYRDRYFPSAEFLIIGHFHWAGTWLRHNLRVINTGSFLNPGNAWWVELENGTLSYGRVDEKKASCRKGPELARWEIGS